MRLWRLVQAWWAMRPRRGDASVRIIERGQEFFVLTERRGWLRWGVQKIAPPDPTFERAVLRLADMSLAIRKRRGLAPGRKFRRRFAKAVIERTGL